MIMMYERDDFRIVHESIRDMRDSGRMNPAQVIVCQGHALTIGAGTSDNLTVFTDDIDNTLYVLSTNSMLDYLGLEIFDLNDGEQVGEVFLQFESDLQGINDMLGMDWQYASEEQIIDKLLEYTA